MLAMISGVIVARATAMHGRVRNRMSPASTAWTMTPLSTSRILIVEGAGSETSYPCSARIVCIWPRNGQMVGVIGLGKFYSSMITRSGAKVFTLLLIAYRNLLLNILQYVIICQEESFSGFCWGFRSRKTRPALSSIAI